MLGNRKKAQMVGTVIAWIIGILVLAIIAVTILIASGKLGSVGDYIKNLIRFGR